MAEARNYGRLYITSEFLGHLLQLPEGHKVRGAEWEFVANSLRVYVEGPLFPTVPPGQVAPEVYPMVTIGEEEDTGRRSISINWSDLAVRK